MNAPGTNCNSHPGNVAAQTDFFSRSSTLPSSFGQYDRFYLSLRSSGKDTRQQQQKQWLRRHQFRGDESVRGAATRRRRNERGQTFNSMSQFSSPMKMDGVYEDDDIEAERRCLFGDGGSSGMDMSGTEREIPSGEDSNREITAGETIHDQKASYKKEVSPPASPFLKKIAPTISVSPAPAIDHHNSSLVSRKHRLSPIDLELQDAFMELTLKMHHSIVTPSEATCIEGKWNVMRPTDGNISPLTSSVEAVVNADSNSSSISSCMNLRMEPVAQAQNMQNQSAVAVRLTPVKTLKQNSTPIKSPAPTNSTPVNFTPLSRAILFEREQPRPSTTLAKSPATPTTITSKRKPQGRISSSCKRRKRESDINMKSITPRQLYNGRAIERISQVCKCTDKHCRWNPSLHKYKTACERCWTLASEVERKSFVENGGRHLRISLVKGGCPSTCTLFSKRVKVPGGNVVEEEDIRLCRKCFDDMHHVGVRQV